MRAYEEDPWGLTPEQMAEYRRRLALRDEELAAIPEEPPF